MTRIPTGIRIIENVAHTALAVAKIRERRKNAATFEIVAPDRRAAA